ncbi:hypothetical protein W97_06004 [Coniosporium apollinis CBS 100218]|uniref:Small ribosomal subunit protein mS29 n=1 Tax=Coniosporium apollinis (strain CBS 100218) TaxID=1168221 RepID=R7YY27_CONA1|nr:uncharacterized protein W97_06004 [Coniosporium apollinis CBS 100218]EON66758.1 hypothetical protein W97_06004 [Coniosporium apollinis CBS 100218]
MPSSRCLLRLPHPPSSLLAAPIAPHTSTSLRHAAPFSASASQCMPAPAKKKGVTFGGPPARGTKALRIKKTVRQSTARPPAPGERRALRKRIVLSNTNALEVAGLRDATLDSLVDEAMVGKVVGLPGQVVDSLRVVEAFKVHQGWGLFRRPACLVRKETVEIGRVVAEAEEQKTTRRVVLCGERNSGKSVLLLQGLAGAFMRGWVVLNFPEAKDLTIGHTAYSPIPNTTPTQYAQRTYTANLLSQISKANASVLSALQITQSHDLPMPLQRNLTLDRLCELGARDPDIAWPIFQALWKELTAPGRPPVFMALDGLAHVMRLSAYLAPDTKPIHAHDLALVNHFVEYLSGQKQLGNGGVVMAAVSESNQPRTPALEHAPRRKQPESFLEHQLRQLKHWNPYVKGDERVIKALDGVEVLRLKGLSREEARGVMEYYAASGMLRNTVTEGFVSEKWSLAGQGIVGELERAAVRLRV